MKISLRLSTKEDFSGKREIILRTNKKAGGKVVTMSAKTELRTLPVFFDKVKGIDLTKKRVIANEVRQWHNEEKRKLDELLTAITEEEVKLRNEDVTSHWLQEVVDRHNHPERYAPKGEQEAKEKDIYELAEIYLLKKQFSEDHIKGFRVLLRGIARYEGFIRATKDKGFSFNVNEVDKETIEDFREYLRKEKELSEQYPKLFEGLLNNYPANIKKGYGMVCGRGENGTVKYMKKLKAFWNWLLDEGITDNRPFEGFKIGAEKQGTPFYISIQERNMIASTPMPTKHLETQRDIFVFQCFVGCRVGDLMKLTKDNITNGILEYTPHKTMNDGEQSRNARIPLHPKALDLIAKYEGVDKKGRLFPFISAQRYNDAIKEIFTKAGIVRNVLVRNSLNGENELRPINEVASSHMARRTFIGNAYKQVSDPNIIGKMSGHTEGSRAFSRYRNIEDETLKAVINLIG